MARVPSITTTGTGATTDWINTGPGEHVLRVRWAGSPGELTIKERDANSSQAWAGVEGPDGSVITVTGNKSIIVAGETDFRLNATTHTSAATLTKKKFKD